MNVYLLVMLILDNLFFCIFCISSNSSWQELTFKYYSGWIQQRNLFLNFFLLLCFFLPDPLNVVAYCCNKQVTSWCFLVVLFRLSYLKFHCLRNTVLVFEIVFCTDLKKRSVVINRLQTDALPYIQQMVLRFYSSTVNKVFIQDCSDFK